MMEMTVLTLFLSPSTMVLGVPPTIRVPVPLEIISVAPPSCRILSLIPLIPTPAVPSNAISSHFSQICPGLCPALDENFAVELAKRSFLPPRRNSDLLMSHMANVEVRTNNLRHIPEQ